MANRIFTDSELEEMGKQTVDLVKQAIDEGDLQKAKKLAGRMNREFYSQHEGFRDTVTALLSFIGRRYGQEALYDALHEGFNSFADLAKIYEKADIERQVEMLAAGLRGHLTNLIIQEDDEKITVIMDPCGSGGRAVINGSYGPPKNFLKVKKHPVMTLGHDDFPVYCCHCPFQDLIPMEINGFPIWVTEPSGNPGKEPCKFILYKDKNLIPAVYYERFGRKKPS
ncbi:MAG: hypothetical protein JXA01_03085 [Dehalococcoidia bacterium]|nr:hypothetical protein [Dehalococcoidia bacterium]